jgi:predicted nucleotidyltransferase
MIEGGFDAGEIVRALQRHKVDFVVIGGIAGQLWGSPTITQDLDICYAREKTNLENLAAALRELKAKLRGVKEDAPFRLDARTLFNGDSFTFTTAFGALDCLATPTGTSGYNDLKQAAETMPVGGGLRVWVCSIDDLIRMKRAAGRRKDLSALEELGALRDERARRRS